MIGMMGVWPRRSRPVAMGGVIVLGVAVWMLATATGMRSPLAPLHRTTIGALPQAVVTSARFRRAFVVHQDGTTDVLDTTTGVVVREVRVGQFGYGQDDIAVAEREARVFVATAGTIGRGTTVSMLDARDGKVIRTVAVGLNPHSVVVDERRGMVFIAMARGISVLDARTGAPVRAIGLGAPVNALTLDARTGHLFVATEGTDIRGLVPVSGGAGAISIVDARAGHVIRAVAVGREPTAMAVDSGTGRLYVVSTVDRTVDVLDTRTGVVVRRVAVAGQPQAVAVDERAGHVFVGATGFMNKWGRFTSPSTLLMLDGRSGAVMRVVALDRSSLWRVVVDARRRRAYVVGDATMVADTRTGAVLRKLAASDGAIGGLVAVDDATGQVLMATSGRTTISDSWGWVPRPLRDLPFLRLRRHVVLPSVSVLDSGG